MNQLVVLSTLLSVAISDIYLHSPRGSNNRLDDENRDRNNGNRLFDSQNNNRGGSNVGNLKYFAGSKLSMIWTAQHSCGNPNNHCEMIVQYMCDDNLRDGTTTKTIPINPEQCYNQNCDTDVRYGRHESFDYYKHCQNRERNKGLFTSSQKLNGDKATKTRQNPNGNRRGLECPEERDYYPYWQPTPWKDLAILTNDETRCEAYKTESQNVKERWYCDVSGYDLERHNQQGGNTKYTIPIFDKTLCEEISFEVDGKQVYGKWSKFNKWGIDAPICTSNAWSRDNHHGNVDGGFFAGINITIPEEIHDSCVMRLRYNITTKDFEHFDSLNTVTSAGLNSSQNKQGNDDYANIEVYKMYGLDEVNGYQLKNNPQVKPFNGNDKLQLQHAINTAQYGRTFEDRTHRFSIVPAPEGTKGHDIYNVEVRGKRGNIVQTYPGTEYEFAPNRLNLRANDDFVHFQWTGSNTNPNNNAGQGRQGSDRSNILTLEAKRYDEPQATDEISDGGLKTHGHWGSSYPAKLDESEFLGFSKEDRMRMALTINTEPMQTSGEMSELDDASTYFNLPPKQCTAAGIYHYLSTRNNNFSNRSQKGKIVCSDEKVISLTIGSTGGELEGNGWRIVVSANAVQQRTEMQMLVEAPEKAGLEGGSNVYIVSDFPKGSQVQINYEPESLKTPTVYIQAQGAEEWTESDSYTCEDGVCSVTTPLSNYSIWVVNETDGGAIAGIVIGVIAFMAVGFLVFRKFVQK